MNIYTTAVFQILALKEGKYEPLTKNEIAELSVGGFSFLIDGKEIPFDFDAFVCNEVQGTFTYESGYGCIFNDFELSHDFDRNLNDMGLFYSDITPIFLSQVTEIREFHLSLTFEKEDGHEYLDLGDILENVKPDAPFKIRLLNFYFERDDDINKYSVKESVLRNFNGDEDPLAANVRKAKELSGNTPDGRICDADTILCDIVSDADFEISGLSEELFSDFLAASEEGKEIIKKMFYLFTDVDFEEYVQRCIDKTTK